jgi:hypothetical protein
MRWFRELPPSELEQRIRSILTDPEFTEPPSLEQAQPVNKWFEEVSTRGDKLFVLDPPDATSGRIDWAFVWLLFHEFICVNSESAELTIAVIGMD